MSPDPFNETNCDLPIADRIQQYLQSVTDPAHYSGFETHPLQQVKYISHSQREQQVIYEGTIPRSLCHKDGNLHGGAATTLLDNLSSTALLTVAQPGFWDRMGVSRSLQVTFHRAVPVGTHVKILCTVMSVGKQMACLRAILTSVEGDKLCVSCIHDKHVTGLKWKL